MAAIMRVDEINRDKIVNFCTEDGYCSDCGNCCSNCLPLTAGEIKAIKKYIKKNHIEAESHVFAVSATNDVDWMCPFRDEINKLCKIYEVRPAICRVFKCDGQIMKSATVGKVKLVDVRMTFYHETIKNSSQYQCVSKLMLAMAGARR